MFGARCPRSTIPMFRGNRPAPAMVSRKNGGDLRVGQFVMGNLERHGGTVAGRSKENKTGTQNADPLSNGRAIRWPCRPAKHLYATLKRLSRSRRSASACRSRRSISAFTAAARIVVEASLPSLLNSCFKCCFGFGRDVADPLFLLKSSDEISGDGHRVSITASASSVILVSRDRQDGADMAMARWLGANMPNVYWAVDVDGPRVGDGGLSKGTKRRIAWSLTCSVRSRSKNPAGLAPYRAGVNDTITKYGGRFLVRGGPTKLKEGSPEPKYIVVVEFPTPPLWTDGITPLNTKRFSRSDLRTQQVACSRWRV